LDNKNASTSNEKVGAVINIVNFGVLAERFLKRKKPEGRSGVGSAFRLVDYV
jgi:hypothetical protein